MAARHIQLGHRWGCHPLWDPDWDTDVDPSLLPIPASLITRLEAWAARWDLTFDHEQPDHPKVERFVIDELGRDGARLWRALLGLLPPQDWEITYVHEDVIYRTITELPLDWRLG